MPTAAEVRAELTGPGGAFETVAATVRGVEMDVYKDRIPNLAAIPPLAAGRGDQTFIVHGDQEITFSEFVQDAHSVSSHLRDDAGIGLGDRVAVLSANNPEWCLAFWGTVQLGAVLVGLNGWWKTDEIVYGLQDSGSRVLVADAKRFERVAAHLDECPDIERVYLIDADRADADDKRIHDFAELTADPTPEQPQVAIDEDDNAIIFYTSGTTGRPKGAVNTHRNMVANLQNTFYTAVAGAMMNPTAGDALGGGGQTVALFTSPLFHVSGCHSTLVTGLLAGIKLVMVDGKFEPDKALQLIQDHDVTLWATVPTMVWRVCEWPGRRDYDTSTVTTVAFGGSPSADELQRLIADTFPNVASTSNAYGLTESSSVATVISGEDALARPDSVGPPVATVEIRIIDDEGDELPTGRPGEVLIKGPTIMAEYWNKPEATAETVRDGWLYTGDVGYLDDDGYLFITDRKKDMIIRGGENIYCVEIENRLHEHPAVADVGVVGVRHPELGEEVKAVVQVESGHAITEDEVRTWVGDALARFKVPAHVEITRERLPRNASGKLLKNVLRGEGEVSFEETM